MTGRRIHVRSSKYDGSPHWEFDSWFVLEDGPLLVTSNFAGQILTNPKGPWRTPYETRNHFWSDRWYNVLRLELPNGGGLHGWYCNVTTPAEYDGENVRYVDLDLDVIVDAQLDAKVVDEDEFLQHSERMAYPPNVIEQSRAAVDELLQLVRSGQPPFDVQ